MRHRSDKRICSAGVTRIDHIQSEVKRHMLGVAPITHKPRARLRCQGHLGSYRMADRFRGTSEVQLLNEC